MIKNITIIVLYIIGIVMGFASVIIYYEYAYGVGNGFNFRNFTIFGVPILYVCISVITDLFICRNKINRITKTAAVSYLPIFISLFFITLSFGNLPIFSLVSIFWYFILFLPILVVGVFIYRVYKYNSDKIKIFLILKYGVSCGLYIYSLIVYFVIQFVALVS